MNEPDLVKLIEASDRLGQGPSNTRLSPRPGLHGAGHTRWWPPQNPADRLHQSACR